MGHLKGLSGQEALKVLMHGRDIDLQAHATLQL
jgi:hypothetical protein